MATGSAARSAGIVTAGTIGDLLAAFEARAAAQGFSLDPAQRDTITHFARLEADLHRAAKKRSGWFAFLSGPDHVRGLYLWGGVGRGKSFLMDGFFEASGEPHKRRVHFHRFMQEIHGRLKTLQGESDPLRRIAAIVAAETRLLCLDEFQVVDIGDAMLLGNLLQALVGEGVAVVTTSNTPPSKLYEHGLQRDNFMPAIRLIEREFDIVQMDHGTDYRQRTLEKAGTWHIPAGAASDRALESAFRQVAGSPGAAETLTIEGRPIEARCVADGVAWFDFSALCEGPRAQADYIELARRFHTVLISGVPRFQASGDADRMRRFTWLVDEFYDRRVKLMITADAPALELHGDVKPSAERDRTASRLVEMQTHQYLGEPHQSG